MPKIGGTARGGLERILARCFPACARDPRFHRRAFATFVIFAMQVNAEQVQSTLLDAVKNFTSTALR
jgi:hypothetical protein